MNQKRTNLESTLSVSPATSTRRIRKASGLMALEPRFMFDGAATTTVADTLGDQVAPQPVDKIAPPASSGNSESATKVTSDVLPKETSRSTDVTARSDIDKSVEKLSGMTREQWNLSQSEMASTLSRLARDPGFDAMMRDVFGSAGTDNAFFEANLGALKNDLLSGNFSVLVELRTDNEMQGLMAAYAAAGPDGKERIYVNSAWLEFGAGSGWITQVMLEEYGHAMDQRLNGLRDAPGDEGELFAARTLGVSINAEQNARIRSENDFAYLQMDGASVEVQHASLNFSNAYRMVYDLNNSGVIEGNLGESAASKEQSTHNFLVKIGNTDASLGAVTISDGSTGLNFSGNDVSASTVVIGGTTYYGWISRPIKSGGIVRGFYFWTDTQFTSLALAQSDGNQDSDGASDNRGFLLVVDQTWFTGQIASTQHAGNLTTGIDSNVGAVTYASLGSSSDRVDSALNSLVPANSAPTPVNDTNTVAEDSTVSGNLISNDSDPNGDALTVLSYTIAGVAGSQTTGSNVLITGVGTINIATNGAYTFTPVANYSGPVPLITYTVQDPFSATATASLSLTVTPVNDPPTAVNDIKTVTEDGPASGNVLTNDNDIDGGTLSVSAFSISGETGPFTVGTAYSIAGVGSFTLNANGSYLFVPVVNYAGAVPVITYTANDGNGGSATATLTLTMTGVNDAPVANADNASGAAFALAEDCAAGVQAAPQTGNVLTNDTDPDITLVAGTTHVVSAVRSELGNGSSWNGTSTLTVVGRYGTLTINPDGSYSYTADPNNAAVIALATNQQQLTETFSYTLSEVGTNPILTASSTLKIVIKGGNDDPVARDDSNYVNELAASTTTNTVVNYGSVTSSAPGVLTNDSDPDGNTLMVTGITTSGTATATYHSGSTSASLTLTFSGTPSQLSTSYYVYFLDSGLNDSTPVILYKDAGLTTLMRPTGVTGNGSNRTVTLDVSTVYFNNGSGAGSRTLSKDDVIAFSSASSNPTAGGGVEYYRATLDSTSSTTTSTFTNVSSASGVLAPNMTINYASGATTYTGVVKTLTYNASGDVTSFTLTSETGTLVDNTSYALNFSKTTSPGTTLYGQYGQLSLASNGSYTYYLTSNALPAGTTYTEKFTYTASDGTCTDTAVLSIQISGTQVVLAATSDAGLEDTANTGSVALGGSTVASATWYGAAVTLGGSGTSIAGVGTLVLNTDGTYTFAPATDYTGPVDTVTYTTASGGVSTLQLSITSVNDAPSGTDKTVSITDKQTYTFSTADFGFSDPLDTPSNNFSYVKITTLPSAGTLKLGGTTVSAGALIPVGSLATLVYTPAENTGSDQAISFTFQVQDDGGTTNSGVNLDPSANTFTLNIARVNDAPVNTIPASRTTNSYTPLTFTGSNTVSVSDLDGSDVNYGLDTVQLTVSGGTLSVTSGSGVTISGDGTQTITLTRTGTPAELQAVLATLVYTPTTSFVGSDTMTITSTDKAGLTDIDVMPITVSADNRPLDVVGSTVNEASPYVLFSVNGFQGQLAKLQLTNGSATSGLDFIPSLEYFDGAAWVAYTPGTYIELPSATVYVRVPVLQDALSEGTETLTLTALNQAGNSNNSGTGGASNPGIGTIRDDGQGNVFLSGATNLTPTPSSDPSYPANLDDDRPLTITDANNANVSDPFINRVIVNEGSSWAVLKISGAANQKVQLSLNNGSAVDADHGLITNNTNTTELEVLVNGSWTKYLTNDWVALNASGNTYVRVAIKQDSVYEGPESFGVVATNTGGRSALGSVVIVDDGTGSVFDPNSTNGALATNPPLDNDLAITVTGYGPVNEASPYAMFQIDATPGAPVLLGVAGSGTRPATTTGFTIQYSYDGSTWMTYDASAPPIAPGSLGTAGPGVFYARVDITSERDASNETSETFNLTGTIGTGASPAPSSTAQTAIVDHADGSNYDGTVSGNTPASNTTSLDDDRGGLSIFDISVNEASPYAVFTVGGTSGQSMTFSLTAGTATASGTDFGKNNALDLEYLNSGGTWTAYDNSNPPTLTSSTILVRTAIKQDTVYEHVETFTLNATQGGATVTGTCSIYDDGTGDIYLATNTSGTADPANSSDNTAGHAYNGVRDDDRPLVAVTDVTVNEASPFAVFQVTLSNSSTQSISFTPSLSSGTATVGTDTQNTPSGVALEYFNGVSWVSASGGVTIAAGNTSVLLRTAIRQDTSFESSESFTLSTGSITGAVKNNGAASGTGTIKDDGTGDIFLSANNTATPSPSTDIGYPTLDDDQTKPVIPPITLAPLAPPLPPANARPPEPPAAPPPAVSKTFNSAVQPLAIKLAPPVELPATNIGDILTSNSGFPIIAIENAPPGLSINKGVTDQYVEQGTTSGKFTIPYDAFMHSKQDAVISLQAKQGDDAPLPVWVKFDPQSGTFEANPPPNFKGKVELKVIARDDDGREATSIFRLFVGDDEPAQPKPQSRNSLSDKIRLAAKRPGLLIPVPIQSPEPADRPVPSMDPAIRPAPVHVG